MNGEFCHLSDDGFGNLIEVPREPFVPHPSPRFPGETRAAGPYAFVVSLWLYSDIETCSPWSPS